MSCLKIENLSKTFTRRTSSGDEQIKAVDNVSFELHTGESIGIIGTSGCGKTTLLNLIMNLFRPDQGSIHKPTPIGVVGQDPYASLCPHLTVERLVAEPLLFLGQKRNFKACQDSIDEVLHFVNLPRSIFGKRYPAQLSGGERQRVGIARALIVQPALLLLDEPTSMLDREVKEEIIVVIRNIINLNSTALLLLTHDIDFSARICDRLLVMDHGRIIENNSTQALLNEPQSSLAQDLINISFDPQKYWRQHYPID